MPVTLAWHEFLRYTDEEREKWRRFFTGNPSSLEAPLQAGGRFATAGALIDHIFLVEKRHLQRLRGEKVDDSTGLSAANAAPLFDYGASVRRELAQYVEELDDDSAGEVRTFMVRDQPWQMTPRKLLFHCLLHETRHWAQIALAVRRQGIDPPGDHDLFFSSALR